MAIPLPPSDLSQVISHTHPQGCGCGCVEEATKLADQYSSTTLLWAFMIRLSNEKDPNAIPPTPPSPSGSQNATARQSLPTDRVEGGRDHDSRGKDQARSTSAAHKITSIASRPCKGKAKDLEKPKQPPSAYLIYQNKVRPSVKLKFPNHTPMEITKEVSTMWKALPHERRQWYIDHARTLRDRWSAELSAYRWKQGVTVKKSIPWSGSQTGEPSSKRRRGGHSLHEPTVKHEIVED